MLLSLGLIKNYRQNKLNKKLLTTTKNWVDFWFAIFNLGKNMNLLFISKTLLDYMSLL